MSLPALWDFKDREGNLYDMKTTKVPLPPGEYVVAGWDEAKGRDRSGHFFIYENFFGERFTWVVLDSLSAYAEEDARNSRPWDITLDPSEYSRDTVRETPSCLEAQQFPRPGYLDPNSPECDDSVAFYYYRNKAVSSFDARAYTQTTELPPTQDRPRWLTNQKSLPVTSILRSR